MAKTKYAGIDYGGGMTNRDPETDIRYGVIGMNSEHLSEFAWDSLEADYGDPACPECGGDVIDFDKVVNEKAYKRHRTHSSHDYACDSCCLILGSDEVTGDEPVGHVIEEEGYAGFVDSHNDMMITKSPYFTYAQFCSPCAPGAGHLENPCDAGPKTYCLGHDWFRDGKAPYVVYEVATGNLVPPPGAEKEPDPPGGGDHEHVFGPVEEARMTGNPHRKCQVPGCNVIDMDLEDDDGEAEEGDADPPGPPG